MTLPTKSRWIAPSAFLLSAANAAYKSTARKLILEEALQRSAKK
jgi:hypothetical protein